MISLSVVKIKVLNVIGRINELDQVTSALGRTRVFHPDNTLSFYSDTTGFSPLNETNPYAKAISTLTDTLKQINKEDELSKIHFPEKAVLPIKDWNAYSENFSLTINTFLKDKQEIEKKIQKYNTDASKISHFDGLDVNFDELKECRFVKIRFGSIPEEGYEKLSEYNENPYVAFFPSKFEKSLYWGMYCAPIDMIEEVDRIFSGLYFEQTSLDEFSGTIESVISKFSQLTNEANEAIKGIESEIQNYWKTEKQNFVDVYTWLTEKFTFYNIRRFAARYGESFILTGWIPADKEISVRSKLDEFNTVEYAFDDAADPDVIPHSPPIKLINKKAFRPFEFFINVYGLPSYNELDPTPFVAFTYILLFGIMFADLGQGLCVALIGWYLWKKKKMALGSVMVPCGISSAIFGTALGSIFGFEHALDPFFKIVFGLSQKPIEAMEQTSTIIYFAISLGIFMVMLAILTNIVACLKRRQYTNGLFGPNGVAGFIFYSSIIFGFGGQMIFGWKLVNPIYVICFMILPLISMLFREVLGGYMEGKPDWKPEKWGEMIMQNFFEVFEYVLSYLTNTISFIRVGAFVLVHAGMMMVVFKLAETSSGIGYAMIILVGNIFVIALEGLLSGVQSLRLEFYEMFSRFYDGSGRPFAPVIVGQES